MIATDKRLRLARLWLVMNLAFIWGNSLLPGEISGAISDWVRELLLALLPGDGPITQGGGLLRKIAHFTEFASLGACLCWLAGMRKKPRFFPVCFGVLAAALDETIQIFVPHRGPSVLDVGIDTLGVLVGMTILTIGHTLRKRCPTSMEE